MKISCCASLLVFVVDVTSCVVEHDYRTRVIAYGVILLRDNSPAWRLSRRRWMSYDRRYSPELLATRFHAMSLMMRATEGGVNHRNLYALEEHLRRGWIASNGTHGITWERGINAWLFYWNRNRNGNIPAGMRIIETLAIFQVCITTTLGSTVNELQWANCACS